MNNKNKKVKKNKDKKKTVKSKKKQNDLEMLNQFILEGINITKRSQGMGTVYYRDLPIVKTDSDVSQERDTVHYKDLQYLDNVFRDYHLWWHEIKSFLLKKTNESKIKFTLISPLLEAGNVPMLKGGIEYSDIKSLESQTLLKNIRTETSKKLDLLREFYKILESKHKHKNRNIELGVSPKKDSTKEHEPLIEFLDGKLKISGYPIISFENDSLRCKLVDFFYNDEERKEWKNYDDIRNGIGDFYIETKKIRETIDYINGRIERNAKKINTHNASRKIKEIIESRAEGRGSKSPKEYRWVS